MKNKFYTFEDLEFKQHPFWRNGFAQQAVMFFANGFGVSVIRIIRPKSYELAVLEGNENNYKIWDNTASYLTPDGVTDYMIEVQKLERREVLK